MIISVVVVISMIVVTENKTSTDVDPR